MNKNIRTRAALFTTALLLFAPLGLAQSDQNASPASPPTRHDMGSRKHYIGLSNFAEVSPNLFRGAQPGADGLKQLKQMGVSIVIDMRSTKSPHEEKAVSELGMRYVSIPWHCPFPTDKTFADFLKVVHDNPDTKIFVHCRLGDDRTGMAIASYRMAVEGWSADEAMKEMHGFGYVGWHRAVCAPLMSYEKEFPDHLKTNPVFKEVQTAKSLGH